MVFLLIVLVLIYIFLEDLSRGGVVLHPAELRKKRQNRKK